MPLTEDDVRSIATYTRIGLDDEHVAAMTVDLNNIIESLAPITEMDLSGVEPTFHPLAGLVNVMREDEQQRGLSTSAALSNTDHVEDNSFVVPPILGGGDD
jgi:aspartyl-tRNA(Asn)/glutamyl-tRNA(Gln) amidotransferase subunit C